MDKRNILYEIIEKKKIEIEKKQKNRSLDDMKKRALEISKADNNIKSFKDALENDNALICEVKKASPSKGIIKEDFNPVEIAKIYKDGKANCLSVLTDEEYFMGKLEYIKDIKKYVDLPILRKDFIISEYQVYESKVFGADAILLIMAALDDETYKNLLSLSKSLNMDVLVETHNEKEIKRALKENPDIIGINNRDLKTFVVDIDISSRLCKLIPDSIIKVSESGIKTRCDIENLKKQGIDAFLIGETLMKSNDILNELKLLKGK